MDEYVLLAVFQRLGAHSTRLQVLLVSSSRRGQTGYGGADGRQYSSRQVSFLSLSDDILYLIFEQYFSTIYYNGRELFYPLYDNYVVLLNKRIFRLASPLLYHHVNAPETPFAQDMAAAYLLRKPQLASLVRRFFTPMLYHSPEVYTFFLSTLTNLSSLDLTTTDEDNDKDLPRPTTDLLKQLVHLRQLRLRNYLDFEDHHFSLERDVPWLQHFEANQHDLFMEIFAEGASTLRTLTIRTPACHFEIPFSTLTNLRWLPTTWKVSSIDGFKATMLQLPRPPVMLKQLSLGFPAFEPATTEESFSFSDLAALLTFLEESPLEQLNIYHINNFHWTANSIRLPTEVLLQLHSFLLTFPSLETLSLAGCPSSSWRGDSSAASIANFDPVDLALCYPCLSGLLSVLKTMSVLEFRYRAMHEEREMRWTRSTPEEEFVQDCWTLAPNNAPRPPSPRPAWFPLLHDKRFCVVLSGTDSEVTALDEVFCSTYHSERIEYFSDKLLGEVVGEALFLLAPIERMSGNGGGPNLGKLGCAVTCQVTNDMGEGLARYFLVPLVKNEFYKQYPELAKMQKEKTREVKATSTVKLKPAASIQKQPSATPSKPAKPNVQLIKTAGQNLGPSAAKALCREEKLKAMAFPSLEAAAQDLLEHLQSLNRTYSFRRYDNNLVLRLPGYPAIIAQASKKEPVSLAKLVAECKKKGAIVLEK
ncbi:hypothetical protein JCM10207_003836 [Rhodosporidiobolus poonsookiae]